jgi:hypothetical protein
MGAGKEIRIQIDKKLVKVRDYGAYSPGKVWTAFL